MRWNDRKGGERGGIIILGGQMKGEGGRGKTDHFMSNLPGRLYCLLLLLHELPLCTKYIDWSKLYHFTLSANQLLTSYTGPFSICSISFPNKLIIGKIWMCRIWSVQCFKDKDLKHASPETLWQVGEFETTRAWKYATSCKYEPTSWYWKYKTYSLFVIAVFNICLSMMDWKSCQVMDVHGSRGHMSTFISAAISHCQAAICGGSDIFCGRRAHCSQSQCLTVLWTRVGAITGTKRFEVGHTAESL